MEYVFAISVRQATLTKFNFLRKLRDVLKLAVIRTGLSCWTTNKKENVF